MYYNLILFILINTGLSIGISRSKLTESLRTTIKKKSKYFGELINCVMCTGFWTSAFVYVYVYKVVDINIVGFLFIGSITAYLINRSNVINLQP